MTGGMDPKFIRQMQERFKRELDQREKEWLEYWKAELEEVLRRRHQELAGLQNDLRRLVGKMEARLGRL
jgi:hypothetical protein